MTKPVVRESRSVYRTPWFEVLERVGEGFDQPYYVLTAADYVTVLPITEDGQVMFVRQFRPAIADYSLELPSGHIDPGETPEQATVRELREETGCETTELIPLGPLAPNTGRMANYLWAFVAKVRRVTDSEPGIEVQPRAVSDVAAMIRNAELAHALDIAVITKAAAAGHLRLFG